MLQNGPSFLFSTSHANDVTCLNLANTQPVVASLCNSKTACALDITQDAYITPDPCPGTSKYLDMEYDCIDPSGQCAGMIHRVVLTYSILYYLHCQCT